MQILTCKSHPGCTSSDAICQRRLAKHNQNRNFSALPLPLLYFYSTSMLPCSISTLLYFALLYSALLYSTLLCFTPLYSARLYSILLYSILLYPILLYSTLLFSTLLYTILFSTLPLLCSTLLYFTSLHYFYSTSASTSTSVLPLLYFTQVPNWTQ